MRRLVVLVPVVLAAAACGGSKHSATTVATTSAAATPRLHVVLRGQDHQPLVGKRWHYEVRVTDAATGKPVACRIHLQFLFGSAPVGEVGVHVVRDGVWQETIGAPGNPPFPPAARGQSLVLRAAVIAKGYRPAQARWPIVVK